MSGPELPENPPGSGDDVLIRYHKSSGRDGAKIVEVMDVERDGGEYTLTGSAGPFEIVTVDTMTLGVSTDFPPDQDGWDRLGVLKALREIDDGERPEADQIVDRFHTVSGLVCVECGGSSGVVRDGEAVCADCGEPLDMEAAEARRVGDVDTSIPDESELDAGPMDLHGHRLGLHQVQHVRGDWICMDCGRRAKFRGLFRSATCED